MLAQLPDRRFPRHVTMAATTMSTRTSYVRDRGQGCFREAVSQAGPILLEPVMRVETVTRGDYLGDVIGEMNRRRGTIQDQIERGANIAVVPGTVPCRKCSATSAAPFDDQRRASYTMEFSHYEPVPKNVADRGDREVAAKKAAANA